MTELTCLLDSKKLIDLDIPQSGTEAKISIDLSMVESFREAIDDDEVCIDNIMVEMKSGNYHCIKMPYDEFKELMNKKAPN